MTRQTMRMCTFSVVCLPARMCFCYSMAHLLQPFHMIKITSTHLEDEEDEEEDEKKREGCRNVWNNCHLKWSWTAANGYCSNGIGRKLKMSVCLLLGSNFFIHSFSSLSLGWQ